MASSKSKVATAVLTFFLGFYGIHKFYLGDKKMGAIRLVIGLVGTILLNVGTATATAAAMTGEVAGGGLAMMGIGWVISAVMGIWTLIDFIKTLMGKVTDAEGNALV